MRRADRLWPAPRGLSDPGAHARPRAGAGRPRGNARADHQRRPEPGRRAPDRCLDDQRAGGGVDEPDLVKSDGTYLYAMARGALQVVDARANPPVRVATLALPDAAGGELLLHGQRLLVVSSVAAPVQRPGPIPVPEPVPATAALTPALGGGTLLTEIDVSEPAARGR